MLNPSPAGLLFKGGTSLAKVFKVIERFSEDIDLSFNQSDLGFSGNSDPAAKTGKHRQRRLDSLTDICRELIRDALLPQLRGSFGSALGKVAGEAWALNFAGDATDQQTLVFRYPVSGTATSNTEPAYIGPVVRLEIGARSDHWPAGNGTVLLYVAEDFPAIFESPTCSVHVLAAERTF
jgi:hypothetical protein